jgi:hypothetical protein
MELIPRLNLVEGLRRKPCREVNQDLHITTASTNPSKPSIKIHKSNPQSTLASSLNSFSLSPNRFNIRLDLVSQGTVQISKQLQQKLKSRCSSRKKNMNKQISIFHRTINWKHESEQKIMRLKTEKDKREILECTFTPKFSRYFNRTRYTPSENKKPSVFIFNESGYSNNMKSNLENIETDSVKNIEKDDLIETYYKNITHTLDTISKEIQESFAHDRNN